MLAGRVTGFENGFRSTWKTGGKRLEMFNLNGPFESLARVRGSEMASPAETSKGARTTMKKGRFDAITFSFMPRYLKPYPVTRIRKEVMESFSPNETCALPLRSVTRSGFQSTGSTFSAAWATRFKAARSEAAALTVVSIGLNRGMGDPSAGDPSLRLPGSGFRVPVPARSPGHRTVKRPRANTNDRATSHRYDDTTPGYHHRPP